MPSLEEHCQESVRLFGKPYMEVHIWLDALFAEYGVRHRRKRHQEAGLKQVARIFRPEAIDPARQHIISDLKAWGWVEGRDPFPEDEGHYVWVMRHKEGVTEIT